MLQNWANAILGLVIIAIAFMGLEAITLTWTLVIVGAVIAVVGLWGALVTPSDQGRHAMR